MLTKARTPALSLRRNGRLAARGCNSLHVKNSLPLTAFLRTLRPTTGGAFIAVFAMRATAGLLLRK